MAVLDPHFWLVSPRFSSGRTDCTRMLTSAVSLHQVAISTDLQPVSDLPSNGQLVTVRGRNWVVTDVQPSALPYDVTAASLGEGATFVSLSSVEDDGLGEELRVLWELESGRKVLNRATLPDVSEGRFDDPAQLGAFLDALRWGAVTSAETTVLQAPFRAGIAVEDYQLEPAIRALSLPRVNLLVADDVGLGKTIEAGLVVQELLLRSRIRRVMVVCPAHLTDKWHDEMLDRFGLDFAIVNSETLSQVRRDRGLHANPFKVYPFTIVSLAWLRGPKAGRLLDEVLSQAGPSRTRPLDLLIVDEAHHVAPPGKGKYAVDSQQTRTVRRLADHAEHRLFMSATPHNGYVESWTALLAMLDPQRFARGVIPDPAALKQILIRRLKTEITNADGTPRYPAREAKDITVTYPPAELQVQELLAEYTRARSAKAAAARAKAKKAGIDLLGLLLKKRYFSSPAAFSSTILAVRDNSQRVDLQWPSGEYDVEYRHRLRPRPRRGPRPAVRRRLHRRRRRRRGRADRAGQGAARRRRDRRRRRRSSSTSSAPGPSSTATRPTPRPPPCSTSCAPPARPDGDVERRAGRRLHRVPRHPALAARPAGEARPRRGGPRRAAVRRDGRRPARRDHARVPARPRPAQAPHHPGDRHRQRGRRPAELLPPAGQLRPAVQPEPARAARRPDRPVRPDQGPARLPLRRQRLADRDARTACRATCSSSRSSPARSRPPAKTSAASTRSSATPSSARCSAAPPATSTSTGPSPRPRPTPR